MSKDTSIHSRSLIEDAGVCSADPADFEDQVCAPEPEYYYDPIHQICSPEPVVKIEYKKVKKGIEKIVRLDGKKILANQAKPFETKTIERKVKKEESQTVTEMPEVMAVEFQPPPVSPEFIGELIGAHEAAILQQEVFVAPRIGASASLCFHCLWEDLDDAGRGRISRPFQPGSVREGCVEPEREFDRESISVLLGATLVSPTQDIRTSIVERIASEQTRGREIDYLLFGFPMTSALNDPQLLEENLEREGEREARIDHDTIPAAAAYSNAVAFAVFSAGDLKVLPETHPSQSSDLGAFLVFHFEGIPVLDHSHSVLVVLPPAWVIPREVEGNGRVGGKRADSTHLHTKVERGSPSQSSRDSGQGEGERDQDSNKRQPSEEWLTL